MESIEQPFDSITRIGAEVPDTSDDKAGLINTKGQSKHFFNGDNPGAESSPLHHPRGTNSILHGPQNKGLRVIIVSSIVFAIAVTIALILTIYLEPKQVHGHAAIACEDARCSEIALRVLQEGGNAVDALVAAAFCLSVVNPAHSGIGGGGFALVHDHKFQKSWGYNFRETAPESLSVKLVGVPGFVKGLAEIHKTHGKLHWRNLLNPAKNLAHYGFSVSLELARVLKTVGSSVFSASPRGEIFLKGNEVKGINDTIQWPELAATLELIQEDPDSLYTGFLKSKFLSDMADYPAPGLKDFTSKDLESYKVKEVEIVKTKFKDLTVIGLSPPASGALVALMLNMIDKLGWKENQGNESLIYHQLIEVFKFAYAHKSLLGDPDFNLSMKNITVNLTSTDLATELLKKLNDNQTFTNDSYYGYPFTPSNSAGMSHISIIDSSELMVSATLSLNSHFGNKILLQNTGVWLNSALTDFTQSPNEQQPSKGPQSSMSPTLLYNEEHPCAHRLIIGATNGEKILTGLVQAIVNSVVFRMNLADAIAAPRVHDQLTDEKTLNENGIPSKVLVDLKSKGHKMVPWDTSESSSMVMGIEKTNDDIRAYSDFRKYGEAAQY